MWFWYAFSGALVGGIITIVHKKTLQTVSSAVLVWTFSLFPILPTLIYVLLTGIPAVGWEYYIFLTASTGLFVFGKLFQFRVMRYADLSVVYPLITFSTFFQYILGILFLGEYINEFGIMGMVCAVVGAYILNIDSKKTHSVFEPIQILVRSIPARTFVFSGLLFSLSSVCDKAALRMSDPPNIPYYMLIGSILTVIVLSVYLFSTQQSWVRQVKENSGMLIFSSILFLIVSFFVLSGIGYGSIALVSAVKRLEIVFVLLISWFVFGDKPTKYSWIGSALMIIGVILIRLE